ALHVLFAPIHARIEVRAGLRVGSALGRDISIVKREERNAKLVNELERRIDLRLRGGLRIDAPGEPRTIERPYPEDVRARPVEGVPETDRDPELVLHSLLAHLAVGLIDGIGKRIGGVRAAVADPPRHVGEKVAAHRAILRSFAPSTRSGENASRDVEF